MSSNNNEITVPYRLYKETVEKSQNVPRFLITHANYQGVAESMEIKLQCDFTIKVFDNQSLDNKNVVVPLISQKATIAASQIGYGATADDIENGAAASAGACIVTNMSSPHYQFFTSKPGVYRVRLTCFIPYLTVKKTGMELGIPASSNNSISFQVPQANASIKIFNGFADVDATNHWIEKAGKEVPNYTIVFAKLPQESQLRIQWTIKTEIVNPSNSSKAIDTKLKPPSIVVVQSTLGSIGEGLLILISKFKYKMLNGSISLFNLLIDKNLNIINVEGEAIKKWELINNESDQKSSTYRNLSVWLDYGVENDYELTVSAEFNMGSTSADVSIPSIRCIGDEITRHRGFIAIEARTNVEISELNSQNLDVIDIKELPLDLSQLSQFPILLGYKFLDPKFQLNLRVKKNLDVQVLVSICEGAHFITTMSNTAAYSTVYLPDTIKKTGKSQGNLKDVSYFAHAVPRPFEGSELTDYSAPVKNSYHERRASISLRDSASLDSSNSFTNNNNNKSYFKSSYHEEANFAKKSNARPRTGVIPVRVEMPVTGNPHYFEQILLDGDKDLFYEFEYKEQISKVKQHRSV
ncbi:hypothetical protein PPL_01748 [Heterostelium album PN500]|uniref:Uncharacterized protein n=1 Tax=Heterostelium pallidum (strain ATCC 26659 / Pp 5 / PN500) TaxID=670386 RepID=D3B0D2_HETP5|nr:hypothetical protein PPL_01748 [Heterostelium album PN500]EFA84756.1 hypothetical protein PPL_01748 [Heterostelium album PN500]|eukprot:XP_020436868.1 hypothetical protein PPL_01748 [Heterostelium album PN500]